MHEYPSVCARAFTHYVTCARSYAQISLFFRRPSRAAPSHEEPQAGRGGAAELLSRGLSRTTRVSVLRWRSATSNTKLSRHTGWSVSSSRPAVLRDCLPVPGWRHSSRARNAARWLCKEPQSHTSHTWPGRAMCDSPATVQLPAVRGVGGGRLFPRASFVHLLFHSDRPRKKVAQERTREGLAVRSPERSLQPLPR